MQHYGARLRLTFLAHLRACQAFYEPAFFSPLWCDEIAVTKRAIEELEQLTDDDPTGAALGYRLHDLRLQPVAGAAVGFQ